MANRLDIELTSQKSPEKWTWKVVGARQPKGEVDATIIPANSKVGDCLKVETEVYMDGISITAVVPAKVDKTSKGTIELSLGLAHIESDAPLVTTTLAKDRANSSGPQSGNKNVRDRSKGKSRSDSRRRQDTKESSPHRSVTGKGPIGNSGGGRTRPAHKSHTSSSRNTSDTHKKALLDSLSPEHRAIAEKLILGGLPAVRAAIEAQNKTSGQSGLPSVPFEPILKMAEELLPSLKVAQWCDRAADALDSLERLSARELRNLVSSSEEAQRDQVGATLVGKLREELERKVQVARREWEAKISQLLAEGQIVRSLKLSATPPDASARVSSDLALALANETSKAMNSQVPPQRWVLLLEAAASSPVRVNIRPEGLPDSCPSELLDSARRLSGRIPAVAKLLGISLPPPPAVTAKPAERVGNRT